jgi:16S rRNA (adenine1518-N6/adenine1519-N6)-dimethyltransferase
MAESEVEGIKLYKRKGQHILKDKNVIRRQIDYAEIEKSETILEIGPGMGALTFELAKRANKVIAIEKDPRLYSYLIDKVPKNVEIIKADVLDVDLPRFHCIVSNIPYQISSQVVFKVLDYEFRIGILMFQKEFAQRMAAGPKEKSYSRLSVNTYYKARCRILEHVPRNAFFPQPDVDSAVVEIIPRKPPFSVNDEELFFKVVERLFAQRRKKVKNSLKDFIARKLREKDAFDSTRLNEIITELPFKDERVEVLSPEDIGRLADKVYDYLKRS